MSMSEETIFNQHWTPAQLDEMRRGSAHDWIKAGAGGVPSFTCDTCDQRTKCIFVFASYNTDGDCLADK